MQQSPAVCQMRSGRPIRINKMKTRNKNPIHKRASRSSVKPTVMQPPGNQDDLIESQKFWNDSAVSFGAGASGTNVLRIQM